MTQYPIPASPTVGRLRFGPFSAEYVQEDRAE